MDFLCMVEEPIATRHTHILEFYDIWYHNIVFHCCRMDYILISTAFYISGLYSHNFTLMHLRRGEILNMVLFLLLFVNVCARGKYFFADSIFSAFSHIFWRTGTLTDTEILNLKDGIRHDFNHTMISIIYCWNSSVTLCQGVNNVFST